MTADAARKVIVRAGELADLSLDAVRQGLRAGFNSKPLKLGSVALSLYNWLEQYAPVKLNGIQLYNSYVPFSWDL
ncbi:MAG: hypothetical protein M3O33_01650 [Cyanobacteriota bacterium]|nr:hypothetical protein [Cyanobacteriota bacterium]